MKLKAKVGTIDSIEADGNKATNQSKQIKIKGGSNHSVMKGSRSIDNNIFETNKSSKRVISESEHKKEHRAVTFEENEMSNRKDRNGLETNVKIQKQKHIRNKAETRGETLQVQVQTSESARNQFETPKERAAYL